MFEKFNELGLDTSAVGFCKEDREDFFACRLEQEFLDGITSCIIASLMTWMKRFFV